MHSPVLCIIPVVKLNVLSTIAKCNKSLSLRTLSLGRYGSSYARPRTATKCSSSMASRTPAMSFMIHSFGSEPREQPCSWLSHVTRTREKHNNGSNELPMILLQWYCNWLSMTLDCNWLSMALNCDWLSIEYVNYIIFFRKIYGFFCIFGHCWCHFMASLNNLG